MKSEIKSGNSKEFKKKGQEKISRSKCNGKFCKKSRITNSEEYIHYLILQFAVTALFEIRKCVIGNFRFWKKYL